MSDVLRRTATLLALSAAAMLAAPSPAGESAGQNTRMLPGGDGLPIAVTYAGRSDAPGIVFVHGFLASHLNWERQLASPLAERFALSAVDLRGHGASAKPWVADAYVNGKLWADDIAAAVRTTGRGKPLLVAWSYGGYAALDYVRAYGTGGIRGLVLVGTHAGLAPRPIPQEVPTAAAQQAATKRVAQSQSANLPEILAWNAGFVEFLTRDGPLPAEDTEKLRLSLAATPHYVRPFLRLRSLDNTDLVARLDLPVLMIQGRQDLSTPFAMAEAAAKSIPGSQFIAYDGFAHMPQWYWPERFNGEVAAFAAATLEQRRP